MHGYVVIDPEALRTVMTAQHMTAAGIAREGGVSSRHVQNMASGDRVRVSSGVAQIVADRLGVPVALIVRQEAHQLDELVAP
jgi:transcriptional regulator with XRE-family HTH domain